MSSKLGGNYTGKKKVFSFLKSQIISRNTQNPDIQTDREGIGINSV